MDTESGFFRAKDLRAIEGIGSHDRLSDFRLIYISRNGLTQLFLAKKNGKLHVVKTLKPEFAADPAAKAALRKEYDAAFLVDSPYVARTYDFLDIEGYGPAIVMEYCPGRSLAEMMADKERLSDADVRAILAGLLKGIDAIHAAGVVHRDIKPSNIIWLPASRSLHIIDFGCADGAVFYLFNDPAGTPDYASPDVYSDSYRTSLKDDYYSAGMTLSAIEPLASDDSRRLLAAVSRPLIAGERVDIDAFLDRRPAVRRWRYVAISLSALLLLTLLLGYILFPTGEKEETAASAPSVVPLEEKTTPVAVPETIPSVSEKTETKKNEEPELPLAPVPIEAIERKEMYMKDGDAKFPEINGVGYHEAKYIVNYKRTDVDRVTVQHTDSYMTMQLMVMEKETAPQERKDRAREAFTNVDSVWNYVERHLVAQFSQFDRTRARGLVFQRQRFWLEENYRPFIP